MKKKKFVVLAMTGIFALALGACDTGNNINDSAEKNFASASGEHTQIAETKTYAGLSSAESVYAMGAVTTISLLSGSAASAGVAALSSRRGAETASEAGNEDFNKYLELIENFLDKENLTTTVEANSDIQYSDYEIKMTVTASDFNGENVHVFYYSETFIRSQEKNKGGETESKTEYAITGVMLSNGMEYTIRGERKEETEQERGESETKSEFCIRAYPEAADYKTYVQMAYETETEEEGDKREEEHSYVYTVIENDRFVQKTSIEAESEVKNGKEETSYKIFFYDAAEGVQSMYSLSRETDEKDVERYKVYYSLYNRDEGAEQGVFVVVINADGDYVYTFSDGYQKRYHGHWD